VFCPKCGKDNNSVVGTCQFCGASLGPSSEACDGSETIVPSFYVVAYAGFWRRFLALLIDGAILMVLNGMLVFASISRLPESGWGFFESNMSVLVAWLYYALMERSFLQATVGKMAIGIFVTDLNGNRVSFGRATGRYFAKIISMAFFFVGYLMAGFTRRKQGLHDLVAGCLVVRKA
jgi:uncharacterized RDD family membrane protein YckC